ncbi:hypothetical protein UT300006_39920 [Clostridium sp. CTA-6]
MIYLNAFTNNLIKQNKESGEQMIDLIINLFICCFTILCFICAFKLSQKLE